MLSYLFPPVCVGCRRLLDEGVLCTSCHATAPEPLPIEPQGIDAIYPYAEPWSTAMHRLKYRGELAIAAVFGALLTEHRDLTRWDLIVPIPLHWTRRWVRGFNQVEHLLESLPSKLRKNVDPTLLTRPHPGPASAVLGATERQASTHGAFAIAPANAARIAGSRVLVVDDVTTTGATLRAACASIKAHRPRQVSGLAFLRTL